MYLKIAVGVILSFILSIFPILFYTYANMENHPPMGETISVCSFSAAVFIFLSGLFTHGARKKAALTALIIVSLFIIQGSIIALTKTPVSMEVITGFAEVLAAATVGLLISYAIFRNKGWESPKST